MPVTVASGIVAGSQDEDRALHLRTEQGDLIVVADGADGTGAGGAAADLVIERARAFIGDDFAALLEDVDRRLFDAGDGGETTAIVLRVTDDSVSGASVGDSSAWLVENTIVDLTSGQTRKPLLGSGRARAVSFNAPRRGMLVAGTDGLFKYAPRERIVACVHLADVEHVADALVAAARMPSGDLHDDIAVVVAG